MGGAAPLRKRGERRVVASFLSALCSLPHGRLGYLFDVGANDGEWTAAVLATHDKSGCARQHPLRAFMVEPQPIFAARLDALRRRWAPSLEYLPAAAWSSEGNLTFTTNKDSRAAHVAAQPGGGTAYDWRRRGDRGVVSVRALDLAALMRRVLTAEDHTTPAFLKLDVEAGEYSLLPHLLLSGGGALCRISHLFVEWHLLRVTEEQRLAALALRLSLGDLISRGCTERRLAGAPPISIVHDETELNRRVPVPGLAERAAFHGHRWGQPLQPVPRGHGQAGNGTASSGIAAAR